MVEESENTSANNHDEIPAKGKGDKKPSNKNAQSSKSLSNDENSQLNSLIAKNFPELLFLAQEPGKTHLDVDDLKKSIESELRNAYMPDPTTEILNSDVNNMKFVGYHSTTTELEKAEQPEHETYEQWLSQHKAIIMSSRKENRQSKAPSLKDVKEAERTKYIRLDVNAVLDKNKDKQQVEETPIETKTYKSSKQPTTKEKSQKKIKDDDDIATQKNFFDLTIRKNIKDTPTEMFRMRGQKPKSKDKDDKKSDKNKETDNYFGKSPDPEK